MHIVNQKLIVEFGDNHSRADSPLKHWRTAAKNTKPNWKHFADLRRTFGSADKVGKFVVFNIGGGKYRLVAIVDYSLGLIIVKGIMTHDEYDRNKWKKIGRASGRGK